MVFTIEIGRRRHLVSVDRQDGLFRVAVDGRAAHVDVAEIDRSTLSLIVADGRSVSHEVGLAATGVPGEFAVHVHGRVLHGVAIGRAGRDDRSGRGPGRGAAGPEGGAGRARHVVAPMPGKVTRVLVSPGETVAARQGVVIIEAMKMENELRSPKDGRVTEVLVTEGMRVEAGRALVVVE